MSIFQKSVLNKYLKTLDLEKISKAKLQFDEFYGDKLRLHNILLMKEENYQEGFLREIFVDVLGYTISPNTNYNLTTEFKNQVGAKKADGAILKDGKATGVIELKSTKTIDLNKVSEQAFNYKNNQPGCRYVITSNFQKLRFYIDNATEYEEFNLFNLSDTDFKLFYLLLNKDAVLSDLPAKLKDETKFSEEDISKKFYRDYQKFKHSIFDNLVKNNPNFDKLVLFKKSQKLLDRFLFVLFAEDTGLIQPNTITKIVSDWQHLRKLDAYQPLYSIFRKYFSYLDKGKDISDWGFVPAYNGGLFKPDEILDNPETKIDDDVLEKDSLNMSSYDFNTEVDVNILGHIFENSLNEIEEIQKNLVGFQNPQGLDTVSKRKKDGVFYTPKYITKYIVENTVGTLCEEKKQELGLNEPLPEDDIRKADGKLTARAKQRFETLENYRRWLLTLKVLDPACGSGAFLNQALSFFMEQHKWIAERQQEITGDASTLFVDIDKAVLENNIYGVDINEESVEIAKLSLWLRTAQKGRPLSDLSGNIKCGNSLIDDPAVAGDKAFDWDKEFPHVFNPDVNEKVYQKMPEHKPDYVKLIKEKAKEAEELSKKAVGISRKVYEYAEKLDILGEKETPYGFNNGGFDVVLGNPPYGVNFNKQEKKYLSQLDTLVPDYEIYIYFISLATDKLLKKNGKLGYIFPNTFLSILYGKHYREKLANNFSINEIVDLSYDNTFVDASVRTCILNLTNSFKDNYSVYFKKISNNLSKEIELQQTYTKQFLTENLDNWLSISSVNSNHQSIITKIKNNPTVNDFFEVSQGLIPYDKYRGHTEFQIKNRVWHSDYKKDDTYRKELKGGDVNRYQLAWNGDLWISYGNWLAAPRKEDFFKKPRVLVREITATSLYCCYTVEEYYNTPSLINIISEKNTLELQYLLTILNSKLTGWYHNNVSPKAKKGLFPKILINDVRNLPIKAISNEAQQPFIEKAELMLSLNKALHEKSQRFIKRIKSNFEAVNITGKLETFYNSDFKTFLSELKKQKIALALTQQDEWEDYFDTYKTEINALQTQIAQTDKELDRMVYALYELKDEEIKIVEDSVG